MAVFLFPGQGAQFSGMGIDLYDADDDGAMGVRSLFDTASSLLGSDIRTLLNADAEVLKQTDVSQIAITVASLAAVKALASRGIKPQACAGFSLGEYSALAVSGVISEKDALSLTITRGQIMQDIANEIAASSPAGQNPGMAAVIGLSPSQVDEVIAKLSVAGLFGANYNSPLQTVISGTSSALEAAEAAFKEAGARRVIRLKVAGPFHSPLMLKAAELFEDVLASFTFNDPVLPLFSNVTGSLVKTGEEAKKCAVSHISCPVRWTDEESSIAKLMAEKNITECIEVGPGKVLSGLWADSKLAGTCKPYTDYLQG